VSLGSEHGDSGPGSHLEKAKIPVRAYLLKYVHAASAINRMVMIHRVESLIPVFLAMGGILNRKTRLREMQE